MTAGTLAARRLPDGFEIRLRDDVMRVDRDRVLVGGSPARVVRLGDRAQALLAARRLIVDGPVTADFARRLLDGNLADPVVDHIDVPSSELTVVVPVKDRAQQLDRCLAALAPLRIVVVDDASADPAAVARVARRHGATVVPLAVNVGPAGARNVGLARVRTPLVAFVDSDVAVDGATLLNLARHCSDPRVALVGPRVVGRVRTERPRWFERYDAAASSLDLGGRGGRVRPGAAVGWLPSACLVGRVDHLRAPGIDGFDVRMRVGEDVDLVWRLDAAALVVRYDPTQRADHDVRGTLRAWCGRKVVYGTGGADLARRHGDHVAPAALSAATAIGAAALLQRRWWSLPVAGLSIVWTTASMRGRLPIEVGATATALRLSGRGLGWALRQESGLLLRHWWPLGLLGAFLSRRVRRALVTAMVVDTVVCVRERRGVELPTLFVARRLDDLAYGAGLWCGALRNRSAVCLAPRRSRPRGQRREARRVRRG